MAFKCAVKKTSLKYKISNVLFEKCTITDFQNCCNFADPHMQCSQPCFFAFLQNYLNLYYRVWYWFDPWWGNIFGQCMGLVPTQLCEEFGC